MSYQESQNLIMEAEKLLEDGDQEGSSAKYLEAAKQQKAFVDSLAPSKVRTRSVYGLSAATLYYRGNDLDAAARLAHRVLSEAEVEAKSAAGLERLLSRIKNDRLLHDKGHKNISAPVCCFLRGDDIGEGIAPANLVDRFTTSVISTFRRMAAWKSKLPFTVRLQQIVSENYRVYQTEAMPGSYAVDFYITGAKQLPLDFEGNEFSSVQPDEVVRSTMDFIRLAISGEDVSSEALNLPPDEEYRTTLLRLVRNMIPDGKGVSELELRLGDHSYETAVTLRPNSKPSLARLINPGIAEVKSKPQTEVTEEQVGILRAVDLDTRKVKLDLPSGQKFAFTVPRTISEDVLTPMLNQQVKVRRYRSANKLKWIVQDLDLSDEADNPVAKPAVNSTE